MEQLYKRKEEKLQIRFNGNDDIDIETFTTVLNSTVNTLKSIADNVVDDDTFCKFKIKDVSKGSFIVDIISLIDNVDLIYMAKVTSGVLGTFLTILEIKKHFKGDKPKEVKRIGNEVEITNYKNEKKIVNNYAFNIYASNPIIDKSLSRGFAKLNEDSERRDLVFKITDEEEQQSVIDFSENDIKGAKNSIPVESLLENTDETQSETTLTIIKPDFRGNSKWEFYYCNTRINAKIADEEFMNKVHNSEYNFGCSTKLRVMLSQTFAVNNVGLPVESSHSVYIVKKVIKVLENNTEQINLF